MCFMISFVTVPQGSNKHFNKHHNPRTPHPWLYLHKIYCHIILPRLLTEEFNLKGYL